ncbi:OmpL47-type beta-barrel domain-containing protein [Paenibacillus luteus]|uniref:golvesin C-terminal-like domain-containing protein n=1 Tax=Paenibacillus luteus TaxID=2545753 RepID=UPI0011423347|nr:Ig-like domain-containing protein [Paenibacillus luteus]
MKIRMTPIHAGRGQLLKIMLCLLLAVALLPVSFTANKVLTAEATAGDMDYFTENETWYRDFAPGIVNPSEGTIELTTRIDKPHAEFGNEYDFLFQLIPEQGGPGNTLINAHIPPSITKPTGLTYDQPLIFFVRNGNGTNEARVKAESSVLNYTVGESFNLAFSWKMGPGGYVAIYKNGVQLQRVSTSLDPVMEKFMPYEFKVERGSPYNISNVRISTKALEANELEQSTTAFARGTDTSLLANIELGQDIQSEKFNTPWQTSSAYSVVKPIFRNEKQVFYKNEAAVYPIMTVNYGDTSKTYSVSIKATDPYGNTAFTEVKEVIIPADGTYRVEELTLPQLNNQVGFWYLETTVSSSLSDAIVYRSGISKVPANDTSVTDGTYADYYGTHSSYSYDMSPWSKINTSATRAWEDATVFLWHKIEPTKGHFTWEHADQYVSAANATDMDVLAVLGYPSDWASTRPPVSALPAVGFEMPAFQYKAERWVSKDIQYQDGVPGTGEDWTNYVYETMKRYAGKVKYYEIVNEVNFHPPYKAAAFSGTKEEYFLMLKIAHEQAQKVKSEYKVETGNELELYVTTSGFTDVSGTSADRQMAVDALNEPYVGYYDIYNIHGYGGTKSIKDDILPAFNQAKSDYPDLKLWQTEFFPFNETHPTIPAKLYGTVERYMDFLANGATRYFNMGIPAEDTFVTRHSQSPTELFQTIAVMQNHIRKVDQYIGSYTGFSNETFLTVNHYMHRTDGNYLSVLSADSQSFNINIQNADKIVSVEDNYGNVIPVSTDGDILKKDTIFIVSNEPLQINSVTGDLVLTTIRNGGFEKLSGDSLGGAAAVTIDNWVMSAGVYGTHAYVNKTSPFQGVNAVEFDSTGAPGNRTFMNQTFTVTKPGTYVLAANIKKLSGGADVQPELNIWAGNTDHQLAPVTLTDQYAYYAKAFTVSQTMSITVNIGILSGVGKVVFDNVSFELVPDNVEIVMDNSDTVGVKFTSSTTSNAWDNTRNNTAANKGNFALNTSKDGKASVTYTPSIPLAGMYDVYEWHHPTSSTTTAPFTINHAGGMTQVEVNQSYSFGGRWNKIGSYPFNIGSTGSVVLTNGFKSENFMLADGIKFVRTGNLPPIFSNGNFESVTGDPLDGPVSTTFDNWSMGTGVYGTNAYVNQTNPYQGEFAAEFNSVGVTGGRTGLSQKFTVLEPGTYTLSAYIKKLDGGAEVQPELSVWDGVSDHQMQPVVLTSQYAYYAKSFVVSQKMDITIKIGILSGVGKVLFDNVAFTLVPDNVEIIMDNKDTVGVTFSGSSWSNTGSNSTAYNGNFAVNTTKSGSSTATYTPNIPQTGMYDVYEWHHRTTGTTDAPFTILNATGSEEVIVDQSQNSAKWNKIGSFPFMQGSTGSVIITNRFHTSNFILADGIRFVRTGPYVPVESITVNGNPNASVLKDGTLTMNAIVMPTNAVNKSVVWSVVNGTGKAEIDPTTGVLTGLDTGTVLVTATALDNTGVKNQLQVKVVQLDHVVLGVNKTILRNGDQAILTVSGILNDGTQADLSEVVATYKSDSALATVDAQGLVTATAAGEGTVQLTVSIKHVTKTSESSVAILVDNSPPLTIAAVSPAEPNGSNGWYTSDVTVALAASDRLSGVAKIEYRVNDEEWNVYTEPFTLDQEGVNKVQYRATDNAGISEELHSTTFMFDKVAPTATVSYSMTSTQDVVATISMSEPVTITNNGGSSSYIFYYNGQFTFTFMDAAGHHGSATAVVDNLISKSKAKPGKPTIFDDNGYDNGMQDGKYNITMNLWYGENARIYKLYENDVLIDTRTLADHTPNAQMVTTAISSKPNGTYRYYVELTNAFGTTKSDTHIVTVTQAAPAKPVLANDNWDGDGSFKVSMNLWWGTNGDTYNLYENSILIDSQELTNGEPNAQTAITILTNRGIGTYEYRAELINYAGAVSSDVMIVRVTK